MKIPEMITTHNKKDSEIARDSFTMYRADIGQHYKYVGTVSVHIRLMTLMVLVLSLESVLYGPHPPQS